jgi:hypothetical protein
MENIVSLDVAKYLKTNNYNKPTEYYYQDKDLPFSPKGLKRTKNGKIMNHNKYDDFIYSAPTNSNALDWILGTKIKYESSLIIKFGKK